MLAGQQPEKQFQLESRPLGSLMQTPFGGSPVSALMKSQPMMAAEAQQVPQELQNKTNEELLAMLAKLEGGQQRSAPSDRAQKIASAFTSPAEKRAEKKLAIQEKGLEIAEKKLALSNSKDYVQTILKKQKSIKEDAAKLDRMVKLINDNKLPNAGMWRFLTDIEETGAVKGGGAGALVGGAAGSIVPGVGTAVGAGAGAALGGIAGALASPLAGLAKSYIRSGSPDVEEYEKLSADFVKNAKQYFGNRLTDADLKAYLQTIPTLMQTDAGKKRVISNIKSLNEMADLEANTIREVLRENKGIPPLDIEMQVYDRVSSKLNELAKLFANR